ncbi:MAG: chemotaxis protein CheW [Chloroflexota bacterium]
MTDEPTPSPQRDVNTTAVLADLTAALRRYRKSEGVAEADILAERAQQYAAAPPERDTDVDALPLLTFEINDRHYGLDVTTVQEVRPMPTVTRVPNAPRYFRGVMNVRGAVVTLLDLMAFLGDGTTSDADELIILDGAVPLGIGVRLIHGVRSVPRATIHPLEDAHYALGVLHNETTDQSTVIIDAIELLTDARLAGKQEK